MWAQARADGTPPNNWLTIFGESAWRWHPTRGEYYLHNTLSNQPDLNYRNPDVIRELLKSVRFWLDTGVDGLRLDSVNLFLHDDRLRNNPPRHLAGRMKREAILTATRASATTSAGRKISTC